MKKLAALLLIALAFCACEETEKLSIEDDNNTEMPTVSFHVSLKYSVHFFLRFQGMDLISDTASRICKYGKIYLSTREQYDKSNPGMDNDLSSFHMPHSIHGLYSPIEDSSYRYNPNDFFCIAERGEYQYVEVIDSTQGRFSDIPYGAYVLLAVSGIYHADTLKAYMGAFKSLVIDSLFVADSIDMTIIGENNFMTSC